MKVTKLPAPPMPLTKQATAYWKSVGTTLIAAHKLETGDLFALALLAGALADVDDCRATVKTTGYTVKGAKGAEKGHPASRQLTIAKAQAMQLLQQFGLTPATRNRAAAARLPEGKDPLSEFGI